MKLLSLPLRVIRRFAAERCSQTAAALSFATLLSLVPMIAITVAGMSRMAWMEGFNRAAQKFLLTYLLPDKAGGLIVKYVAVLAEKTGNLTWMGFAILAFTALTQMLTIEHTFNDIWSVKEGRPLLRRVAIHLLALGLGPLLFGVSIAITAYLVTASLGWVEAGRQVAVNAFRVLSFAFSAGMLSLLYWKLPNRKTTWHVPVVGGSIAAVVFALVQWAFGSYVAGFSNYRVMYGAFAAIPVFMLWLYLSWSVVLIGALVTADMEKGGRVSPRGSVARKG